MDHMNNQDDILKESGEFFTDEEMLEVDEVLLKINEEIMKAAGEISRILGNGDGMIRKLREAYLLAAAKLKEKAADLEDTIKALKEEKNAKQELMNKYKDLETKNNELKAELDGADREKDIISGRIQELEKELFKQEEKYQSLETESRRIQEDYSQHYTDARNDKEKAESSLEQCRDDLEKEMEKAKRLQELLEKESEEKEAKAGEAEELKEKLSAETGRVRELNEKMQQYELQKQKMPVLMQLFDAYNIIMEKKNELPKEFFERLQNVVPLDDFDGFLSRALKPSFPACYYMSVQSFITVCSRRGEVSGETVKEALCILDDLLSAVFDFGSEGFKEEKLSRIKIEAGDPFDSYSCKYIDENGGIYGNVVKVWFHGFRDEKNNKTYCSYVEGE